MRHRRDRSVRRRWLPGFVAGAAIALAGPVIGADLQGRSDAERARVAAVTQSATDFSRPEPYERNPGGGATSLGPVDRSVFSRPSANMTFQRQLDFRVGDGIFRKLWVSAPSSTTASDGLGPFFNARSCQSCHLRNGRGHPPQGDEEAVSLLLRLSIPPQTDEHRAALESGRLAVIPEPVYGRQLQNFSVQGLLAEGRMAVTYADEPVALADGEVIHLRRPSYRVVDLNYGPLHPAALLSPRLAPPLIGLGLLDAIADDDILAWADADDSDGDGISGRPNFVWSDVHQRVMLGRFGWKAGQPTVADQAAHAFAVDLGLSTPVLAAAHGDCTEAQAACGAAPAGGDPAHGHEATRAMFDLTVFYAENLAVPARRDVAAPQVLAGKKLFYEAGCTGCHRPKFVTLRDPERPEQSFQLIWPYTDLLLHDMGDGLADGTPEGRAAGREWRTQPLWGLGLARVVSDFPTYLHDGRARSLLEAILWHGGEAEAAKQKVVGMRRKDRQALLAFLNSL